MREAILILSVLRDAVTMAIGVRIMGFFSLSGCEKGKGYHNRETKET